MSGKTTKLILLVNNRNSFWITITLNNGNEFASKHKNLYYIHRFMNRLHTSHMFLDLHTCTIENIKIDKYCSERWIDIMSLLIHWIQSCVAKMFFFFKFCYVDETEAFTNALYNCIVLNAKIAFIFTCLTMQVYGMFINASVSATHQTIQSSPFWADIAKLLWNCNPWIATC